MCGFCNVWVCVCMYVGFVMCGCACIWVLKCVFCNVWVCVRVGFAMRIVLYCVGVYICGICNMCVCVCEFYNVLV